MPGGNGKNGKGFSGLSDLTSDVSTVDEPSQVASSPKPKPKPKPEPQPQPQPQPDQVSSSHTVTPEERSDPSGSPQPGTGPSGRNTGAIWAVCIIASIFVFWFATNDRQEKKKTSYTPSPSKVAQPYNYPKSSPPPVKATGTTQPSGLKYEKPPVGKNNVLSVSQIRWCEREKMRIETMRDIPDTNDGIAAFNRIVNSYNGYCESYRYRTGTLEQARRDVQSDRNQIIADAIREGRNLGRYSSPNSSSSTSSYSRTTSSYPPPSSSYGDASTSSQRTNKCVDSNGSIFYTNKDCSKSGMSGGSGSASRSTNYNIDYDSRSSRNSSRKTITGSSSSSARKNNTSKSILYLVKLPDQENSGGMHVAKCPKCNKWSLGYYDSMSGMQVTCDRCLQPRIVP